MGLTGKLELSWGLAIWI